MLRENKNLKIIPEKLKEARLARGYTVTALAEKIGISKQTISKYELGQSSPSSETMIKYCNFLNFDINFFMFNNEDSNNNYGTIFFRSLKSAESQVREEIKIRIKWTNYIYQYINEFIEFPKLNLPDFEEKSLENLDLYKIEDIADKLREYWNIGKGPINNLSILLEQNGIILCNSNINNVKVDACSEVINNTAIFFIRTNAISACRLRFDLAHELGHLILHSEITKEELENKEILDRIEKEANMFASAFLLPREEFSNEVLALSLDHFVNLKSRWKVSIAAMIYRCKELGIFSDSQVLYLRKQISLKKWRTIEPLDDVITVENPKLLSNAIKLIIINNLQTKDQISKSINIPKQDLLVLSNLPLDYLDEKIDLKIKQNILNFNDFKNET